MKFGGDRETEMAAFVANPLSLTVPEASFEAWLRDTGYLELLDQRSSDLHRHSTTTTTTTPSTSAAEAAPTTTATTTATAITIGIFMWLVSYIGTLISVFTFKPFSKLTNDDFAGETPSWTLGFIGFFDSYSFPSSPSQARMRVQENVKRYARNYATLLIVFFACSLYQIPIALVGLISALALWEGFKFCGDRWGLDQYPVLKQCLICLAQCATAVILFFSNVQMALLCALIVSYVVTVLHAAFRKLTAVKQPIRGRRR